MPARKKLGPSRKVFQKYSKYAKKRGRPANVTKGLANAIKKIALSNCETKESLQTGTRNLGLTHNAIAVILNPVLVAQGTGDPMAGTTARIGDKLTIKGVLIKGMFENALNRPKVFYRIIVTRSSKGDTINASTLFKGDSSNKMIDQVNTDRFHIVAQKCFTLTSSNTTAVTVNADGSVASGNPAGIATKVVKMWIPGWKFGSGGELQYEDGSSAQPKLFDYRVCILVYDWYGSDGTSPTVGRVNDIYSKIYFKDP